MTSFEDIKYISTNLSDLCGIPLRIKENGKIVYFHSLSSFPKDPYLIEDKHIISTKNVDYFATKDLFYYCLVNHKKYQIILGPFRLNKPDEFILNSLAFELNLNKEETTKFINAMKLINPMPLESVIQSLCMVNFILNNEKMTLKEIIINSEKAENLDKTIKNNIADNEFNNLEVDYGNNSFPIEQELNRMVEHGEIDELKQWMNKIPAIRPGVLSTNLIRQVKNTFIAASTVVSRSSIKGGLDSNNALSLSDLYIQRMETMNNIEEIYTLQMNMVLDFTTRVAKIRGKNESSKLIIELNKYILLHLSDAIKSNEICKSLFVSKSVLFSKVKKETGLTLSNYILNFKINESKSLLKYTNKSILQISIYLGFSSQSHFNNTFKKFTNFTPIQYKQNH